MKKIIFLLMLSWMALPTMAQIPAKYIPESALGVLSINADSYSKKVDMDKVMELELFKMMDEQAKNGLQDQYDLISKIYKAPSEAGVNLFPKSYAYVEAQDSSYFASFIFSIADQAKFEELLQGSIVPMATDQKIMKGKGFSYLTQLQGTTAMGICWNDKVAMIMGVEGEGSAGLYEGLDFDDPNYYDKLEARKKEIGTARMEILMANADRVSGIKKTIVSNPNFVMFDKSTYDVGAWVNMEIVGKLMIERSEAQMMNAGMMGGGMMNSFQHLYDQSYYHAVLNFNAGNADLSLKTYMSADKIKGYGKVYQKNLNPEFFKYVRGKELLGFGAMAVDIKELFAMAIEMYRPLMDNMPQFQGKAGPALDLMGIALDEDALANIVRGDLMVGVTDVREVETTYIDYEYDENYNMNKVEKTRKDVQPIVTALATIGNKDHFMKIVNALESYGLMKKSGVFYEMTIPNASFSPKIAIQGDLLIVSNDEQIFVNLAKGFGKSDQVNAKLQLEVLKHNQFYYADITNIINKTIAIDTPPEKEKEVMMLVNEYMRDARLSGIDNKGTHFQYDFQIDMEDQKTNSAMQLFIMANKIFLMKSEE